MSLFIKLSLLTRLLQRIVSPYNRYSTKHTELNNAIRNKQRLDQLDLIRTPQTDSNEVRLNLNEKTTNRIKYGLYDPPIITTDS